MVKPPDGCLLSPPPFVLCCGFSDFLLSFNPNKSRITLDRFCCEVAEAAGVAGVEAGAEPEGGVDNDVEPVAVAVASS